ncbi:MAG: BON domain-containing protein [Bryobacteraceae bacterium]|nr:BON domain-containing protein [Bryobacteraceae bacterium]
MRILLLLLALWTPLPAQKKPVSDDAIYDQVRRILANDPDVKGGAFEVDVKQGVVTVKGKVSAEKSRQKVDKLVKKAKGVTEVKNQVVVAP